MIRIPINFNWKFKPDFKPEYISPEFDDSDFETVHLPHCNIEVPAGYFEESIYQFESCYRKELNIRKLEDNECVYIAFEGIMTAAKVYLNGQFIGRHLGGFTPFRLNLTAELSPDGRNFLTVHVDSHERADIPPFGGIVDFLTFGGIYREAEIQYCHKLHLENTIIKPLEVTDESALIETDLYLINMTARTEIFTVRQDLILNDKTLRTSQEELSLSAEEKQVKTIRLKTTDPQHWQPGLPVLHHLKLTLFLNGAAVDEEVYRFGIRKAEFRTDGFFLNGKRINLIGLNRHQSYPYTGFAMPRSAQYRDAEILKNELAVDMVRLSHYPQSRHFLDRCDELGLLVFDEIPGWQHIGDKAWQDLSVKNVEEMILADANHPSVCIWGVRINESQDNDDFYSRTNETAHRMDSSRQTGGVRCFTGSSLLEDVYTYNDFVFDGRSRPVISPSKAVKKKVPYLITEHNGHMFPTKKYDVEAHRLSQALRHLEVINAASANSQISGAIGWSMFDYYTHRDFGSGDRICYHGVMDMFRIPKLSAAVYESQQDNYPVLKVSSSMNIGENEGSLLGDVYVFTNCDYVKFYKNGSFVKAFYPLKQRYPAMKHPPVLIDDFLGNAIKENETFSDRDAKIVKKLLTKVSRNGENLPLKDKIRLGWLLMRNRMNYQQAENLYLKYFGGWGGTATEYLFEGYINDKKVMQVEKAQNAAVSLRLEIDSSTLVEDESWETTRCIIHAEDAQRNDAQYIFEPIRLECSGAVELIGPRNISLISGSAGFWVKTMGIAGIGEVKISSERFNEIRGRFTVEKRKAVC